MWFISEQLGGEIFPPKFSDSPLHAEACNKLYLKYKKTATKFANLPSAGHLDNLNIYDR